MKRPRGSIRLAKKTGLAAADLLCGNTLIVLAKVVQGGAPSVREIADDMKLSSTNAVHLHLLRLRRLGLIDWEDGKARTLRPTFTFTPASQLP
jgi:SOS-response transcriptional repressor LexA